MGAGCWVVVAVYLAGLAVMVCAVTRAVLRANRKRQRRLGYAGERAELQNRQPHGRAWLCGTCGRIGSYVQDDYPMSPTYSSAGWGRPRLGYPDGPLGLWTCPACLFHAGYRVHRPTAPKRERIAVRDRITGRMTPVAGTYVEPHHRLELCSLGDVPDRTVEELDALGYAYWRKEDKVHADE